MIERWNICVFYVLRRREPQLIDMLEWLKTFIASWGEIAVFYSGIESCPLLLESFYAFDESWISLFHPFHINFISIEIKIDWVKNKIGSFTLREAISMLMVFRMIKWKEFMGWIPNTIFLEKVGVTFRQWYGWTEQGLEWRVGG